MNLLSWLFTTKPNPEIESAVLNLQVHLLHMASIAEEYILSLIGEKTRCLRSSISGQEALFMYINIADRLFFAIFGPPLRDIAMQRVIESLPQRFVKSNFENATPQFLSAVCKEFARNLKSAEAEYGQFPSVQGLPGPDLYFRCAQNIANGLGHDESWPSIWPLATTLMSIDGDHSMIAKVKQLGDALSRTK